MESDADTIPTVSYNGPSAGEKSIGLWQTICGNCYSALQ